MKTVPHTLNPLTNGKPYHQEGKDSSSKQKATSSLLLLREGLNCRAKIILKPTGRVCAYQSRAEGPYQRISLKGIPSFIAANKGDRTAQMLQDSYVVFHRGTIELKPRGCGGMRRRDKSQTMLQNPTLQQLNLSVNHIGTEGAKTLAKALEKNLNLLQLSLSTNQIDAKGALALAGVLGKNPNLQQLDLSNNQIGAEGAKTLARALEKSINLLQLNLSSNHIGNEGANALAGALEKNLNLQQLNLRKNQIGAEGANALAGALEKNLNLRQLDLLDNQIGNEGALALVKALEKNPNLQQLNARPCGPSINMCESHISTIKLFGTEGKNNCSTVRGCGEQFCTVSVDRNESESHLMSLVNEKDREVEPLFSGRRPVGSTTTNPKEWKGRNNNCRWSIIPAGSAGVVCREMMTEKVERSHWGEQRLQLGAQAVIARRFGSREKSESCIVAMKGRNWLRAKAGYLVDANREVRNE